MAVAQKPLLISGPTASGKSALALAEAAKGGIVINADASQVYEGWRILTARPSDEDMARAPHRLFGHVDPSRRYSVGDWLRDVGEALQEAEDHQLRPIIIGGSGLYFMALTEGLAEIPTPPEEIRQDIAARLEADGIGALAAELGARDPATAEITDLANPMRVTRALEVLAATGRGLSDWWDETPPPLVSEADRWLIAPDREALYARCDLRFDQMIEAGALDEARAMLARNLDPILPAMKAIGAPPLFSYLQGACDLDAAREEAKQSTRNFAKRQMTWMRRRMSDWSVWRA